jgi:predicted ABC-type ATPase
MHPLLDSRPIVIALAGPNGAGKSTFFAAHLRSSGLRFVNADNLARELNLEAYEAARLANALRVELIKRRESFIFETVLSDPVGDKVTFLKEVAASGYNVALCYIGISSSIVAEERVAMRVSQGGHDVPTEKLAGRFPRTLANLKIAIQALPLVLVYDNDDLAFRRVAEFESGRMTFITDPIPPWFEPLLK